MSPSRHTADGALLKMPGLLLAAVICLIATSGAHAATLKIPDTLIRSNAGVAPNVLMTFDNSGSMGRYFLPESIDGGALYPRDASSVYNKMYYNPSITYEPGIDTSGVSHPASYSAAWGDGYNRTGCTVNLGTSYAVSWYSGDTCSGSTASDTGGANGKAYYFVYDPSVSGCGNLDTNNNIIVTASNNACYKQVIIDSSKTYDSRDTVTNKSLRTDCANNTACTYAEESQNFANWYSYYRNRLNSAKSSVSLAFWQLSTGVRVAYLPINHSSSASFPLFKEFTGTDKTAFMSNVQSESAGGNTPLREALVDAGEAFSSTGVNSPYAENPGVSTGTEYTCRQNFNILVTDGYWNLPSNTSASGYTLPNDPGAYDGKAAVALPETLIDANSGIGTYKKDSPYYDSSGTGSYLPTTLADIAFYYWITDLRGNLGNNVPPFIADATSDYDGDGTPGTAKDKAWNALNDPATWQHMVTYTIGLGLNGYLKYDDNYFNKPFDEPTNKAANITAWPGIAAIDTNDMAKVDDLWHAAVNGRGHYFNATDPNSLVQSFSSVLNNIAARTGSASAVATASADYQVGTSVYQTKFDGNDWHGDLIAMDVVDSTVYWQATSTLNAQNKNGVGRTIFTYNPTTSTGIPFQYASIDSNVATSNGLTQKIVDYLRGDQSNEVSNGGSLRNRMYILGDIIHSAPEYVGPPDRLFPDTLESAPYSAFVAKYADRTPMVWVGANDGMVHGFDASNGNTTSGQELLAYVPYSVYGNLASLSKPNYSHKYFVDGSPISRDVFYSNAWHTVLVGGLNNGGQGIYALDITDPKNFTESAANASSTVLWEFTDANDADLGKTFGDPQIVKMNNGQWMAVFGNGYNNTLADSHVSTTGDAVLYFVDMGTGSLVKKLDTLVGMAQDPAKKNQPNGLSSIAVADVDGNYTVDYIYAGDLFGNLWKIDVTDSNPANWKIASSGGSPAPLFIATDSKGNAQPITSAPVVGLHTSLSGLIIGFGTGKYLETGDEMSTTVQSFYAVWDRLESTTNITTIGSSSRAGRTSLFPRTVTSTNTTQFTNSDAGTTSDDTFLWYTGKGLPSLPTTTGPNTYLGWYLDLLEADGSALGERITSNPVLLGDRVIFVSDTYTSPNPCQGNSSSWITEVSFASGMPPSTSNFDYNGDGYVDSKDLVDFGGVKVVGTRYRLKSGDRLSGLTIISDPTTHNEVKLSSTSSGKLAKVLEKGDQAFVGRRSWIELLP